MTEAVRKRIELNATAIEQGYHLCHVEVRKKFRDQYWVTGNLPPERRRALETLMWHLLRCIDLLDLESPNHLPLDVWCDVRADVSDAFLDQCTSCELAALVDSFRKFNVPKQYLFDMLDGADTWIRNGKFTSYEDLVTFAYRMGGAPMVAAVPILGFVKAGFEVPAIKCGKAIVLTHLLANCVNNMKQNKNFLATEDLDDCEIVVHRIKLREGGKSWNHLVRLYCARIEKLFYEGGQLIHFLDFDGVRTVKSLLGLHWKILMKMKLDPDVALHEEGVLTKRDWFALRSRHIMGTEGNIPVIPHDNGHH
jgi:phytoene/squalene synthetase